ncbi:MAG: hypothetical protein Q7R64_03595 [bacterium]|nr:hypothetical protein [bacterium]
MDILSHGLWGSISFGRKSRKDFWLSFLFGLLPDFITFAPFFTAVFFGIFPRPIFSLEAHPPVYDMPLFVHQFYNVTHSLVVFALLFALVWLVRKKPLLPLLAWPLHIIFDIFTHTEAFFPTPFLWPVSNYHVSLVNWSNPRIFVPNVVLLLVLYLWFFLRKRAHVRLANRFSDRTSV